MSPSLSADTSNKFDLRRPDAAPNATPDPTLDQARLVRSRNRGRKSASLKSSLSSRLSQTTKDDRSQLSQLAPAPRVARNGVEWLPAPGWEKFHWLWNGFSTRRGGVSRAYSLDKQQGELNLGFTATDDRQSVSSNRRLLVEAITGNPDTPLVTVRQIHSSVVVVGVPAIAGGQPLKADGLMTNQPGLLLGIQTADCIPVLVADRKRRAVAAFHAGWRGTVKRIVEAGIGRMRLEFGSRPEDLIAAIGPGIGVCCYSVGDEVLAEFESQFAYARELFIEVDDTDPVRARFPMMFLNQRAPGHGPVEMRLHLNLAEANRRQLLAAGLKPQSIQIVGGCTSCQPNLFFSHRASEGHAGRMMSVIGVRASRR
jgi:YfiH family protein